MFGGGGPAQGGRPPASDSDPARNAKLAVPPACPRCDLMKSQFTRTIQNYQKAYRKKVEGLKTELRSSRTSNEQLQKQVRSLKGITRLHLPSIALGVLTTVAVNQVLRVLRRRRKAEPAEEPGAAAPAGEAVVA